MVVPAPPNKGGGLRFIRFPARHDFPMKPFLPNKFTLTNPGQRSCQVADFPRPSNPRPSNPHQFSWEDNRAPFLLGLLTTLLARGAPVVSKAAKVAPRHTPCSFSPCSSGHGPGLSLQLTHVKDEKVSRVLVNTFPFAEQHGGRANDQQSPASVKSRYAFFQ